MEIKKNGHLMSALSEDFAGTLGHGGLTYDQWHEVLILRRDRNLTLVVDKQLKSRHVISAVPIYFDGGTVIGRFNGMINGLSISSLEAPLREIQLIGGSLKSLSETMNGTTQITGSQTSGAMPGVTRTEPGTTSGTAGTTSGAAGATSGAAGATSGAAGANSGAAGATTGVPNTATVGASGAPGTTTSPSPIQDVASQMLPTQFVPRTQGSDPSGNGALRNGHSTAPGVGNAMGRNGEMRNGAPTEVTTDGQADIVIVPGNDPRKVNLRIAPRRIDFQYVPKKQPEPTEPTEPAQMAEEEAVASIPPPSNGGRSVPTSIPVNTEPVKSPSSEDLMNDLLKENNDFYADPDIGDLDLDYRFSSLVDTPPDGDNGGLKFEDPFIKREGDSPWWFYLKVALFLIVCVVILWLLYSMFFKYSAVGGSRTASYVGGGIRGARSVGGAIVMAPSVSGFK